MSVNRRRLLKGGALAALSALAAWDSRASTSGARHIEFANIHTREHLQVQFWRDGDYDPAALEQIDRVLRDFRTDQRHPIDPKLLDYLVAVASSMGRPASFSVISGYRSPETNEKLRARSSGVSQRSLHMQGRAIDVRMTGVDCADLARHAIDLRQGGVGYYRASDFVHLDSGAFRTWRG